MRAISFIVFVSMSDCIEDLRAARCAAARTRTGGSVDGLLKDIDAVCRD
jgi:hypothetical protein